MLDYPLIRNTIIGNLFTATGVPVIMSDQSGPRPAFPFVSYTVTSPYLPIGGPIKTQMAAGGVLYDVTTYQVEMVFSFTAHSQDPDEALNLALRVLDYYRNTAPALLGEYGMAVVSVSGVQNRDQLMVMEYERRSGLDVRFRVLDRKVEPLEYIERATIIQTADLTEKE